jgi:hypothetical protein
MGKLIGDENNKTEMMMPWLDNRQKLARLHRERSHSGFFFDKL